MWETLPFLPASDLSSFNVPFNTFSFFKEKKSFQLEGQYWNKMKGCY